MAFARLPALFPHEQAIISAIGFPHDMKHVAQDGNRTQNCLQDHIRDHTRQRYDGCPTPPSGHNYDQRRYARGGVAYTRNPADQEIEAETDLRSGDAEHIVEHGGNMIEMFVGGVCRYFSGATEEHVKSVTD